MTTEEMEALPGAARCSASFSMAQALEAAARLGVRGLVAEVGAGFGTPCLLLADDATSHVARFLPDASATAAGVAAVLAFVDEAPDGPALPTSLFVAYEAGVSLMGRGAGDAYQPACGVAARALRHRSGIAFPPSGPLRFGASVALDRLIDAIRPASGADTSLGELRLPDDNDAVRHHARIMALREQIAAGDVYQANLAHTLEVAPRDFDAGLTAYAHAVSSAPPPFAAVCDGADGTLLSFSPECFLRFEDKTVSAWPIKGTRPRGATPEEDAALRAELVASEKDAAEHDMIVDLLRNDLGRCAPTGSVGVAAHRRVLSVRHVHHLESVITAARPTRDVAPTLLAALPAGSITGAPKSTAVRAIAALEEAPRGAYTGHFGVLVNGQGALNILIRTWERLDDGPGAFKVGGGIVWQSESDAEWRETLDKSRAMR